MRNADALEAVLVGCFRELIANKRRERLRLILILGVVVILVALDLAHII